MKNVYKLAGGVLLFLVLFSATPVHAVTMRDIEAQLIALQKEVAELKAELMKKSTPITGDYSNTRTEIKADINELIKNGSVKGMQLVLTKDLSKGMSGEEVSRLQQYLKVNRYLPLEVKTNGYFGEQTEMAVRRMQSAMGLTVTGTAGPSTRTFIQNNSLIVTSNQVSMLGQARVAGMMIDGYPDVYYWLEGKKNSDGTCTILGKRMPDFTGFKNEATGESGASCMFMIITNEETGTLYVMWGYELPEHTH